MVLSRGTEKNKCLGVEPSVDCYAVLHHPVKLSKHSGMDTLADELGAKKIYYDITWQKVQRRSWTCGECLRRLGNRWYQSEWNALVPCWDEWRIRKQIEAGPAIVHFLWAEFARPINAKPYRRKRLRLVGTFHASARKQLSVIRSSEVFKVFDVITLMSQSQKKFFVEKGYPEERIHIILHGVDTNFFVPGPENRSEDGQPLKGLLVGKTERDHEFMVEVLRRIPRGVLDFSVCTSPEHLQLYYRDVPGVKALPWLDDDGLRTQYQQADLLLMPVHDCAANNAVLEAMACGTPIVANRVGGLPEYVPPEAGILTDGKNLEEWIETLRMLVHQRARLRAMGRAARQRAEELSWSRIALQFERIYRVLIVNAG